MGVRLDLAAGQQPRHGCLSVDIAPAAKPDIRADLFAPRWLVWDAGVHVQLTEPGTWPRVFGDSCVDFLYSAHFVEHVPDLIAFMNEAYRVLVPGGTFKIRHPYQHSDRAWQDPTHVRALSEASWFYYDEKWRRLTAKIDHYEDTFTCDFEVIHIEWILAEGIEKRLNFNQRKIEEAKRHWVNVVDDLVVTLRSRKKS